MPVEGIFAGFFGVGHLVLDLVLARGELNGQIPELRHIERPAILGRTPAVHFLHRQPVKAVVPVVGGEEIQRIAEQAQIDAPGGLFVHQRLGALVHDEPVCKHLPRPFHHIGVLLGAGQLAFQIGDLAVPRLDLTFAVLAFLFQSLGKLILFFFELDFIGAQPLDLLAQIRSFRILFHKLHFIRELQLGELLGPFVGHRPGFLHHPGGFMQQILPRSRQKLDMPKIPILITGERISSLKQRFQILFPLFGRGFIGENLRLVPKPNRLPKHHVSRLQLTARCLSQDGQKAGIQRIGAAEALHLFGKSSGIVRERSFGRRLVPDGQLTEKRLMAHTRPGPRRNSRTWRYIQNGTGLREGLGLLRPICKNNGGKLVLTGIHQSGQLFHLRDRVKFGHAAVQGQNVAESKGRVLHQPPHHRQPVDFRLRAASLRI